jgi:TetR/AcrR family transcriptional regulator, cholesterol catabolism regulator
MTVQERIIEQATAMFLRSGIKAITMNDISREAGVSKRTIYENFHDKNDLLRHCLAYMDKQFNKEHETVVNESAHIIQLVFSMMKIGIKAINQISPLFFEDLKRYHTKVWKEVYKINMEKQKVQIQTILKKGINQGLFRKEIDIEILTILLMQQLQIMPDKSVYPPDRFSQSVVFETLMFIFFRGIATQKGLDLIDKMLTDDGDFFMTV